MEVVDPYGHNLDLINIILLATKTDHIEIGTDVITEKDGFLDIKSTLFTFQTN